MNEWSLDVKTTKGVTTTTGPVHGDQFKKLVVPIVPHVPGAPAAHARVSVSYTSGIDYGAEKVTATVTLNCNQDEPTIDRAGELAFLKAVELVTDAWAELTRGRATP